MLQIKDECITLDELRSRFSNITSVQTMIDIHTIQFLVSKIVRISPPPRQLLWISYVSNTRRVGRPQKCSREAMYDSLKLVMHDMQEINLDQLAASLSHWYFDALDATFWKNLLDLIVIQRNLYLRVPVPPTEMRASTVEEKWQAISSKRFKTRIFSKRSSVSPPRRRSQPRERWITSCVSCMIL